MAAASSEVQVLNHLWRYELNPCGNGLQIQVQGTSENGLGDYFAARTNGSTEVSA